MPKRPFERRPAGKASRSTSASESLPDSAARPSDDDRTATVNSTQALSRFQSDVLTELRAIRSSVATLAVIVSIVFAISIVGALIAWLA